MKLSCGFINIEWSCSQSAHQAIKYTWYLCTTVFDNILLWFWMLLRYSLRVFLLCHVHCLYPHCWCFSWINNLNLKCTHGVCELYSIHLVELYRSLTHSLARSLTRSLLIVCRILEINQAFIYRDIKDCFRTKNCINSKVAILLNPIAMYTINVRNCM